MKKKENERYDEQLTSRIISDNRENDLKQEELKRWGFEQGRVLASDICARTPAGLKYSVEQKSGKNSAHENCSEQNSGKNSANENLSEVRV